MEKRQSLYGLRKDVNHYTDYGGATSYLATMRTRRDYMAYGGTSITIWAKKGRQWTAS